MCISCPLFQQGISETKPLFPIIADQPSSSSSPQPTSQPIKSEREETPPMEPDSTTNEPQPGTSVDAANVKEEDKEKSSEDE